MGGRSEMGQAGPDEQEHAAEVEPITQWLLEARGGDKDALSQLYEAVYPVLRRMAHGRAALGAGGTLQPTAIVNELFLKLYGSSALEATDRKHFFATCARAMRFIVTDAARRKLARKRGEGAPRVTLETAHGSQPDKAEELLEIDAALDDLEALNPRLRELTELKFYVGLTHAEVGELQGCSERSIKRNWQKARAFLMARSADHSAGS